MKDIHYIKELILMGATKDKIKDVFDKLEEEKGIKINIKMAKSLEEAVNIAKEYS